MTGSAARSERVQSLTPEAGAPARGPGHARPTVDRSIHHVREQYRRIARYYDIVYPLLLGRGSGALVRLRDPAPHEHVLEIGAGTGFTFPHYPAGVRVTAIDVCPEMISVAARKGPRVRARVTLLAMDAHDLAFRDEAFDVVLFPHSLGLMEDPDRVLGEAARVTREGAELRILHTFEWANRALRRFEIALYDLGEDRLGWGRPLNVDRTIAWCVKRGFALTERRRYGWKTMLVFRKRSR